VEKISGIVRANSRVTTADNKNAAPARTGMPTFGRPPGESTPVTTKTTSTASRAVALHNGITEAKKAISQERVIQQMADEFFMSRARPDTPVQESISVPVRADAASAEESVVAEVEAQEVEVPDRDYTPRGSYLNVHA